MTTIVVPVDGSARSESALRPGASLAAAFGGEMVVVTAQGGPDAADADRLADIVSMMAGVVPVSVVLSEGDAPEVIASTAAKRRPSLICMATHGRGALARAVMGSVADAVVRAADVPIVLVGDECRTVPLPGERTRMVVCHDGSEASEAVVTVAATFARGAGVAIRLVEVVPPDENVPHEFAVDDLPAGSAEAAAAMERLRRTRERLLDAAAIDGAITTDDDGNPIDVDIEVLHGADVGRTVHHFAGHVGASLVAAATHGSTGVRRLAAGSVALDIVRRSRVPVVLVRSGAGRDHAPG